MGERSEGLQAWSQGAEVWGAFGMEKLWGTPNIIAPTAVDWSEEEEAAPEPYHRTVERCARCR